MLFHYRNKKRNGSAILEYTLLVVVLIAAVLTMQKYILRGMGGRWRSIGDTFGSGRQYDPRKTTECIYDMSVSAWIGLSCQNACIAGCDSAWGVGANKVCEKACPGSCTIGACQ